MTNQTYNARTSEHSQPRRGPVLQLLSEYIHDYLENRIKPGACIRLLDVGKYRALLRIRPAWAVRRKVTRKLEPKD